MIAGPNMHIQQFYRAIYVAAYQSNKAFVVASTFKFTGDYIAVLLFSMLACLLPLV